MNSGSPRRKTEDDDTTRAAGEPHGSNSFVQFRSDHLSACVCSFQRLSISLAVVVAVGGIAKREVCPVLFETFIEIAKTYSGSKTVHRTASAKKSWVKNGFSETL